MNNYYYKEIFSNQFAYIPFWLNKDALNMTLSQKDNVWTLNTKHNSVALDKLDRIKGIHSFLFFGGEFLALIFLTLFFSWGMFFNAGTASQFAFFIATSAILYILTYKIGLNKGLFFIGMYINLFVSVFFVYEAYGYNGVFITFAFYCALWVILAIIVPKLIEKYELYKNPEDKIMWFSIEDSKGFMMYCYKSDQLSEEKALKLREQRGFKQESNKNKKQKNNKKQYDEDDE